MISRRGFTKLLAALPFCGGMARAKPKAEDVKALNEIKRATDTLTASLQAFADGKPDCLTQPPTYTATVDGKTYCGVAEYRNGVWFCDFSDERYWVGKS